MQFNINAIYADEKHLLSKLIWWTTLIQGSPPRLDHTVAPIENQVCDNQPVTHLKGWRSQYLGPFMTRMLYHLENSVLRVIFNPLKRPVCLAL